MKIRLSVFSLIILFAISSLALGKEGGGGKGVVCRDANKNIRSVELLDLWEAKNLRGQQIVQSTGSFKNDLDLAIERTKNMVAEEEYLKLDGSSYKIAEETVH